MRYLSVCSGIEAASVAWEPLGWEAAAFSEIAPFPSAVLAHRFPNVPNLGDMTKYQEWPDVGPVQLLVGGTPCQSFSVAGLRGGMADPRGNLALVFLGLAARLRPLWVVWENVPGVLSSAEGRDFGSFLGGLGELGYGFAYRVLDAQYFGLAQRRKRVFVVGHLGDWRRAAAVLFERDCLSGNPPPSRQAGEGVAASPASGSHPGSNAAGRRREVNLVAKSLRARANASHREDSDNYVPVANPLGSHHRRDDLDHDTYVPAISPALKARDGKGPSSDGDGDGAPLVVHAFAQNQRDEVREMAVAGALAAEPGMKQQTYVAFTQNQEGDVLTGDVMASIGTNQNATGRNTPKVQLGMGVRRLTPRECERLQGFSDDWTLVPYRGKPASDGPRYAAIGNSMAVPVVRWIGERIGQVAEIQTGG